MNFGTAQKSTQDALRCRIIRNRIEGVMLKMLVKISLIAIAHIGLISCALCGDLETPKEGSRTLSKRYVISHDSILARINKNGGERRGYIIGDDGQEPTIILSKTQSLEDTIVVNLTFNEVFYNAPTESLAVDHFVMLNDSISFDQKISPRLLACALATSDDNPFSEQQLLACSPIGESVTLKRVEIEFDPKKVIRILQRSALLN